MPIDCEIYFDQHPDPMWIFDAQSLRFLAVNDAAIDKYGYSHDEFLAMSIADVRLHENLPELLENLRTIGSGLENLGVVRHRTKSGQTLYMDITTHTLVYEGVLAELVTARDKTRLLHLERERDDFTEEERKLRQQAESAAYHFQSLFEAAPGKLLVVTPGDHRIVTASDAFLETTNTCRQDIVGRTLIEVFPEPADQMDAGGVGPMGRSLARVEASGAADVMETLHYRIPMPASQGGGFENRFWSAVHSPVKGPDGELAFIIQRTEDITDILTPSLVPVPEVKEVSQIVGGSPELDAILRTHELKAAYEALYISEERLALVSKATTDVIWDWDLERDIFWWSEGFGATFGYDSASVEPGPESRSNRIHPNERTRVLSELQAAIDGEKDHWRNEYRLRHADGHYLTVVDRGSIIRDAAGRAVRMTGSLTDVTHRRQLDEQLRQSQKLEAIGQLTGGVAHDFNNLLVVIIGAAESLQTVHVGDPARIELADMIIAAGERGAELTRHLLAFGRKQALEPRAVDVNNLLEGMGGLLRRALGEDVELLVARCHDEWQVFSDPAQLESALLNLAINARHAMPTGGKLTIECENVSLGDSYHAANPDTAVGDYVMIAVTDSGEGMSPDVIERAFEPFFTTKPAGQGSGLGLSMVHGFVRQSKGNVKIYSELGVGTTVKLYLPRAAVEAEQPIAVRARDGLPTGVETILLVEDDDLVRSYAEYQLESLGYTVIVAENGAAALAMLHTLGKIDLLFTDVVMPGGVNGRQLADQALQARADLKVLYTSGYTENAIVHHGMLDAGINLLTKPYQGRSLALKLREVLDG